jgi:hypothetical protein
MFTTKSKGQGFGLPVVKRMTESLGGTVSFESQEGKGTTFIVRITPEKGSNPRILPLSVKLVDMLTEMPKDTPTAGKSDQFPLDQRSRRATPESNIDDEIALLVDPTRFSDPPLLWFLDSGEITSRASRGFTQMRAQETINVLNLNDVRLVEARKALWNQCQSLMRRADNAYKKYDELHSVVANAEYEQILLEMCNLIRRDREFSATARACFHGSPYFWIMSEIR